MNATGSIRVAQQINSLGAIERQEYRWTGNALCRVERYFVPTETIGAIFMIGPYRLRLIEIEPWSDQDLCARVDYPFWWVLVGWHRVNRIVDLIYHRAIITLAVWGLARFDPAQSQVGMTSERLGANAT